MITPAQAMQGLPVGADPGLAYYFLPAPVRLLDTRVANPACITPGAQQVGGVDAYEYVVRMTCTGIPGNARGIQGNVSVVNQAGQGFLTLYPAGKTRPLVASMNYNTILPVFNVVHFVGLSVGNAFRIYSSQTTDIILDIVGYFAKP